jgi:hypothetical protein
MKRNIFILLIVVSILFVFSILIFASETIDVKDYIKGKFPVIFNIYLASLGELDEYEKEFIELLQNLPEEEQKNFAKEVYNNGFSKEILEKIKEESITEPDKSETEIEKKKIEEPSIPKDYFNLRIDTLPYRGAVLFIDWDGDADLSEYVLTVDVGQNGRFMQKEMPVEVIDNQLVAEIVDLMYVIGSDLNIVLNIENENGELYAYEYSLPFEHYWPWIDWMLDIDEPVSLDIPGIGYNFKYDWPKIATGLGAHSSWDFMTRHGDDVNVYSSTVGVVYRMFPLAGEGNLEVYNPHVGAIVQYGHTAPVDDLYIGQDLLPGDLIAKVIREERHIHYSIIRPFSYHRNIREISVQFKPSDKWSGYYWPAIVSNDRFIYSAEYYQDPFYFHEPATLGYWYEDTLPDGLHEQMLEIFQRDNPGVELPAIEPMVD